MNEITLDNIQASELPNGWTERLGVQPDDLVSITIRRRGYMESPKKLDWIAIQKILDEVDALPVLDNRTPDEILNYNEFELPI